MEREQRYEVNSNGKLVIGEPVTLSSAERKDMIEKMFSINGWTYTILQEISQSHFHIKLENTNLGISKTFHLYHGNVRKEDPDRNREEKKIQLGTENDPREYMDNAIILGFYVYENKNLSDAIVVAWPVEEGKNYPNNPSLRVNMKTDVVPAKNTGYYVDKVTGKNLVVFRPEFIYHYIENYKDLQYSVDAISNPSDDIDSNGTPNIVEENRIKGGRNVLLYGVPGCGKSYTIQTKYCKDVDGIERVVFHPDFTYGDFVGQILPITKPDNTIEYVFSPGPFSRILFEAYNNPDKKYCLVIEELNRGNAPAIFGDIFQLLDRDEQGTSSYSISNTDIAGIVYSGDKSKKVFIPSNLSILATMNTSDQNVFTLDTAFQRRWKMRMIENDVNKATTISNLKILDTSITWSRFNKVINAQILVKNMGMTSSEDKRLGAYFVSSQDLIYQDPTAEGLSAEQIEEVIDNNHNFPEKVLKYLWDDAFKFTRQEVFKEEYTSLEQLISAFESATGDDRFGIFVDDIFNLNN